jgi:hypothetical protein
MVIPLLKLETNFTQKLWSELVRKGLFGEYWRHGTVHGLLAIEVDILKPISRSGKWRVASGE